jgi:hypothetical protein
MQLGRYVDAYGAQRHLRWAKGKYNRALIAGGIVLASSMIFGLIGGFLGLVLGGIAAMLVRRRYKKVYDRYFAVQAEVLRTNQGLGSVRPPPASQDPPRPLLPLALRIGDAMNQVPVPYGGTSARRCDICRGQCWLSWTGPDNRQSRVECPYCRGTGTNAWRISEAASDQRNANSRRRLLFWWAVLQIPVSIVCALVNGQNWPVAFDTMMLFGDLAAFVVLIWFGWKKLTASPLHTSTETAVALGVAAAAAFDMAMHHHRRATPPPVQDAVRNVLGH